MPAMPLPSIRIRCLLILFCGLLPDLFRDTVSATETVSLTPVRDNSIVMVDGEWNQNAGANGRIRIKGNQHIVAMAFDLSVLKGRTVRRARLICSQASEDIAGITISTIAVPWDENASNGLTAGTQPLSGWGAPGLRFPAVCGGNSFTLVHHTTQAVENGVYSWDVAPDLIHANILGLAFGLALHEHSADYSRNPSIYAREQSGRAPRLELELESVAEPPPTTPTELSIRMTPAQVPELSFRAPSDGFALQVNVDDREVQRTEIPLLQPGQLQRVRLFELLSETSTASRVEVAVRAINRSGAVSPWAKLTTEKFPRPPRLTTIPESSPPSVAAEVPDGISVLPICDRYDSDGRAVGELPDSYRRRNSIFDGRRVTLSGAAGEVVSLQLLLRGEGRQSVQIDFPGRTPRIDLFEAVYVKSAGRQIPDPLLPLPGTVLLQPQRDVVIAADIFIPFEAAAGVWSGSIRISDGRVVPLTVEVLPFQIPRTASFVCEMNGYGLPDHVDDYYALQRAAYDHRVHLNILHYSHNTAAPGARKSNLDMRLRSGKRMDNRRYDAIEAGSDSGYWDDFAVAFGPVLDGSLFADQHRGPIPVPGFYLTFHESWPLNCRQFFNGNPDAFQAFADHPEYAATWTRILQDFAHVASDRGWTKTHFQVYLNNKGSPDDPAKSPWILDEPAGFWDYRALKFYGELTDAGRASHPQTRIDYRIDISRPEYARGQLEGRADHWVVSAAAFRDYRSLVQAQQQRNDLKLWIYGSTPDVHQSSRSLQAWAVDSWLAGASGLVPWQTVNKTGSALREADPLGVFIMDSSVGDRPVVRQTLRLKAWRETQQLLEYLILLKTGHDLTPAQLSDLISEHVEIRTEVKQQNAEDAGVLQAASISADGWERLRQTVSKLLSTATAQP